MCEGSLSIYFGQIQEDLLMNFTRLNTEICELNNEVTD